MSDDFKYQYSAKIGTNNLDMLNIRTDSEEELRVALDLDDELLAKIAGFGDQLRSVANAAAGLGASPTNDQNSYQQQPAGYQQNSAPQQNYQQQNQGGGGGFQPGQPDPSGRTCKQGHGIRVWKAGTSRAGKPYKMWACPANIDSCKPEWVN